MDQTGVNLVPASSWTYEKQGSVDVSTVGAEDKRQITACLASSLYGDLLPLQLIFKGTTPRCLPVPTAASRAARVHITFSHNHWSSQQTMQHWVVEVLLPYAERCIDTFKLRSDAAVILVLDVWAVHKSEEFRRFLRTHHPRIYLVFVPANCTSKLQVADVALQRPFKGSIRRCFNQWAAEQLHQQIEAGAVVGFQECFKMGNIKPLVQQWCVDSWMELQANKGIIANGWYRCCLSLYDVHDREKRVEALAMVAQQELDVAHVPDEEEKEPDEESDGEESADEESSFEFACSSTGEDDELDMSLPVAQGARRSIRQRGPPPAAAGSYMLNTQLIVMTEDSE
jgi:hypothetical protein